MHKLITCLLSDRRFILPAMLVMLCFATLPVLAQTTGWIQDPAHPPVKVRLLSTGHLDSDNRTLEMVLDVALEGEWKTYWRSPGEGGIAPELDWRESQNIRNIEWRWPVPAYYEQLGVQTLGYKHQVHFPLLVEVNDLNQPVWLKANLRLPSCTNICVVTDYPIELNVDPHDLSPDSEAAYLFAQGSSQTPARNGQIEAVANYWDHNTQTLTVELRSETPWQEPQVLIDGPDVADDFFSEPTLQIDGHTLFARFHVSNWLGKADLRDKSVLITVSDTLLLSETRTLVSTTPLTLPQNGNVLWMIGVALLGGLILNIMPCVLPVLGMKINTLLVNQSASRGHIRLSFLASAGGIITSFLLLALGLSLLKFAGHAVGWGIQFQNPWFIGFMALITLLFSANLFGLFEFRLPGGLNTWLATKGNHSYSGHFIQGAFATLLATPCSAPFLGTAVAYALAASYLEMWMIFFALGVGMSLPWLVMAVCPSLVKWLPKPGRWMSHVKWLFAGMMLLTSLWLVWLMKNFTGTGLSLLMMGTVLLSVGVLLARRYGRQATVPMAVVTIFALGGGLITGSLTANSWATPIVDDLTWQPLDATAIPTLVSQGKVVFVNVTADWCITCKANKIGVILQDPVYSALKAQGIVLMQGDWTKPSDSVTAYLREHGRFGVPFNIVYGPDAASGIALPVILSDTEVIQALHSAGSEHDKKK